MKTFSQVRDYLNNVPCINEGGCAISAIAMLRWLKANEKTTGQEMIVYIYAWEGDKQYKQNIEALENKTNNLTSCEHALLWRGENKRMVDSYQRVYPEYKSAKVILTEEQTIHTINRPGWNISFDRVPWVERIAKKLKIDLTDIQPLII